MQEQSDDDDDANDDKSDFNEASIGAGKLIFICAFYNIAI